MLSDMADQYSTDAVIQVTCNLRVTSVWWNSCVFNTKHVSMSHHVRHVNRWNTSLCIPALMKLSSIIVSFSSQNLLTLVEEYIGK